MYLSSKEKHTFQSTMLLYTIHLYSLQFIQSIHFIHFDVWIIIINFEQKTTLKIHGWDFPYDKHWSENMNNPKRRCLNIRWFSLCWPILTEFGDLIFGQIKIFHYSKSIFDWKNGFNTLKYPRCIEICNLNHLYLRFQQIWPNLDK